MTGGFDLGLEQAGFEIAWQVELDPHCNKVLERHWPGVKRYGDITKIDTAELEPVDVVCGGFPCQDLSVAGKRAGLAGERSGLFFEFMRILAGIRPSWVVIENVPGLLSSNGGKDMGTVLGTLGQLGYGHAYRVLDAQYFGVAQRRRRVFIVGHFGEPWPAPAKVLFEPESCDRDTPPSRKAGKVAPTLSSSGAGTSRTGNERTEADMLIPEIARALTFGRTSNHYDDSQPTYISIQDAAMPREKKQNGIGVSIGGPMYTLDGNGAHAVGFQERDDLAHAIRANPSKADKPDSTTYIASRMAVDARNGTEGDITMTLQSHSANGTSINKIPLLREKMTVRRLTPLECERLQGFRDGWTKEESDSARYRMLGNAVCVPVTEWIGKRLMAF